VCVGGGGGSAANEVMLRRLCSLLLSGTAVVVRAQVCGCVSEWGEGSTAYPESLIEHYGRPRHTRSQQSRNDPLMVLVAGWVRLVLVRPQVLPDIRPDA